VGGLIVLLRDDHQRQRPLACLDRQVQLAAQSAPGAPEGVVGLLAGDPARSLALPLLPWRPPGLDALEQQRLQPRPLLVGEFPGPMRGACLTTPTSEMGPHRWPVRIPGRALPGQRPGSRTSHRLASRTVDWGMRAWPGASDPWVGREHRVDTRKRVAGSPTIHGLSVGSSSAAMGGTAMT
jgi:hypothetical protein